MTELSLHDETDAGGGIPKNQENGKWQKSLKK